MGNYIVIECTHWGWVITSNFGEKQRYVGYTRKQAIKKYRDTYGMKGKHITVFP